MINLFEKFLNDDVAHEFFITGVAGTGKTTSLAELIKYCIDNKISTQTCAYTHKAVKVLRSKLPTENNWHKTSTLHSFLSKRPTINSNAKHIKEVDGNTDGVVTDEARVNILFIDEFSMVGEKDYVDIAAAQYDDNGNLLMKVVYIGDPNQLPPVKDIQSIYPRGKYVVTLTKIYRQENDSKLLDVLVKLNEYINGKPAEPLEANEDFIRGVDIANAYINDKNTNKVILTYTNLQVEKLNAKIQGRPYPELGDVVFSPTIKKIMAIEAIKTAADEIHKISNDKVYLNSKYHTLETLNENDDINFYTLLDANDIVKTYAVVFGHHKYATTKSKLANIAVKLNKEIEQKYNVKSAKDWAQNNYNNPLAKERAHAWRNFMAFNECVICLDFAHAMTVHKSQGSTYDNVYLDTNDIGKCATTNYPLYLKLLYVGISRASKKVFTN